jgi:hypothetical protein
MRTKIIAFMVAVVSGGALGPDSKPPEEQPDKKPPGTIPRENVYFCCHDVDHATKSGDGCITIGEKQIDSCASVLTCADGFTKEDGTVTCL